MFQQLSSTSTTHARDRRGAVTVLAALFSVVLIGMVAFAVDLGYVLSVKEEMQRSADAAALAACWDYCQALVDGDDSNEAQCSARGSASYFAGSNEISQQAPALATNYSNSAEGDLVFGYVSDVYASNPQLDTSQTDLFNAVQVTVRRDQSMNGTVPYFFARVFGQTDQSLETFAMAAIVRDIKGFQTPHSGGNIHLLPFTLDLDTWTDWVGGCGEDNWTWNPDTKACSPGGDGVLEVNLYPQGTGSPGNRGTVDIGSENNSTSDIARQILEGISPQDFAAHTRPLEFDSCGKCLLNGDTGISAGVKDELKAIRGQPRVIPIFSDVVNPGNNAEYTIVKWYGICIVDVKLTGPMNKKHVTIQAAPVTCEGAVPATTTGSSGYVFSPVFLLK